MLRIPRPLRAIVVRMAAFVAVCASASASACDGEALTTSKRSQRQVQVIGFALQGQQYDVGRSIAAARQPDLPLDGLVIKFPDQPLPWEEKDPAPEALERALSAATMAGAAEAPRLRQSFMHWQTGQEPSWGDAKFQERAAKAWTFAGKLITAGKLKGLFLDPIPYMYPVWRQPAAMSASEARAAAKDRGLVVGRALYAEAPEAVVVLALGYSEVFRQVCLGPEPIKLEDSPYMLYPAFLDGLFAARDETKTRPQIIDSFLPAYITKQPEAFPVFRNLMHFRWEDVVETWRPNIQTLYNTTPEFPKVINWASQAPQLACDSTVLAQLGRDLPAATSMWLDAAATIGGPMPFSATDISRNWFSPMQAAAAFSAAVEATDGYIFIWLQATSWFPSSDFDPLPSAYAEAVKISRP